MFKTQQYPDRVEGQFFDPEKKPSSSEDSKEKNSVGRWSKQEQLAFIEGISKNF